MKIELKTNKKLFNNFFMYKEKGENIILGGGDGSARLEILLQFFLYMVKNNLIDKNSVFVDLVSYQSVPIKIQRVQREGLIPSSQNFNKKIKKLKRK